jgi:hypothetical protein
MTECERQRYNSGRMGREELLTVLLREAESRVSENGTHAGVRTSSDCQPGKIANPWAHGLAGDFGG